MAKIAFTDKTQPGGYNSDTNRLNADDANEIKTSVNAAYDAISAKYDADNPSGYITSSGVPTALSAFTNDVNFATVSQLMVGRNAANFGESASMPDVAHYANTGGDNTFAVGAWMNFLTGTGTVAVQVTWTDGHGITHTKTFYESGDPSGTAYGGTVNTSFAFDVKTLRVKDATTVQVATIVTGTVVYEVGAWINKIIGDGGL